MFKCDECGDMTNKSYSDGRGWLCEVCWEKLLPDYSVDNSVETKTKSYTIKSNERKIP